MTIEEVFSDLYDKYGEDFNWYMIPLTQADGVFVTELKNEIGEDHFLYDKRIWAAAKCESNDDVLYVTDNGRNADIYYIFHLTYSKYNSDGFPQLYLYYQMHALFVPVNELADFVYTC